MAIKKKKKKRQPLTDARLTQLIIIKVARNFSTFGAGQSGGGFNPIADALQHRPAMFSAGVDVADVILYVLEERKAICREESQD